jgi:hypothetical protein
VRNRGKIGFILGCPGREDTQLRGQPTSGLATGWPPHQDGWVGKLNCLARSPRNNATMFVSGSVSRLQNAAPLSVAASSVSKDDMLRCLVVLQYLTLWLKYTFVYKFQTFLSPTVCQFSLSASSYIPNIS